MRSPIRQWLRGESDAVSKAETVGPVTFRKPFRCLGTDLFAIITRRNETQYLKTEEEAA